MLSEMNGPETNTEIFTRVLRGILRPLVRALIAQGITAPAIYRLLKRVYVEVAEQDLAGGAERPTDSRISVLTGVHRRDVRTFREEAGGGTQAVHQKVSVIASVLGRWLATQTDELGTARPLSRAEFDDLATSVSLDVRPRTVLDEVVRQGLVTVQDDILTLKASAFVGPEDMDQRIYFFGENVGDHIAAATDNLFAERPRFMERAVFYNCLTPASVDAIERLARDRGTEMLADINRLAHDRQDRDLQDGAGSERFRFGVFFYRVDEDSEASATPEPEEPADTGERDAT